MTAFFIKSEKSARLQLKSLDEKRLIIYD